MEDFVSIGKLCRLMGISLSTAYRRIKAGTLVPAFRTSEGHRRFDTCSRAAPDQPLRVVTYGRVSSADQKNDLVVQSEKLKQYVEQRYAGAEYRHISDLGSGLNYRKKGLKQLLQLILLKQVDVLVLNHRDRLLRFGAELVFKLCTFNRVAVEIVGTSVTEKSFEEELTVDVIELMTVFCARLYGKRSHRNKNKVGTPSCYVDTNVST